MLHLLGFASADVGIGLAVAVAVAVAEVCVSASSLLLSRLCLTDESGRGGTLAHDR